MREHLQIKFDDKVNLNGYVWKNENVEPKAIIEISHGMAEHILRYDEFAEKLAAEGYIVYGFDHYAHGGSRYEGQGLGVCTDYDFMTAIIKDIKTVREYIGVVNKDGLDVYLFAHSMGSMAAQRYIQLYPHDFKKAIICGTDFAGNKYKLAKKLLSREIKKHGEISYVPFVENLGCGAFGKKFKNEGINAWLTTNPDSVAKYNADEWCGAQFPTNYYYSMANMMTQIAKANKENNFKCRPQILLIAGKDDPVGNFGKGVTKVYKTYDKCGYDAQLILYETARHELLNEIEGIKNQVVLDVISFYN